MSGQFRAVVFVQSKSSPEGDDTREVALELHLLRVRITAVVKRRCAWLASHLLKVFVSRTHE